MEIHPLETKQEESLRLKINLWDASKKAADAQS